jgi:hypothetical protein
VDCGCEISTNPFGVFQVPTPAIVTAIPVPVVSVTDQDSLTVWIPPIRTVDGLAVNELIWGAGHWATLTVTNRSMLQEPFALTAVRR